MLFVVFSLVAFNILSLSLIFASLITCVLGCSSLGYPTLGAWWASWTWLTISYPMLGKFSAIISSNIFLDSLPLASPSRTPTVQMLVHLILFQRSLRLSSSFFQSFSLYSLLWQWFPPFCLPGQLSILMPQLFYYWFFVVYCSALFFKFSRSLENISYTVSILLLRSWIMFTMFILNSFSWRLPKAFV